MEGKSKGSQALPQGDRERQPVLKGKNRDKEKGKEKEDSEARKLFTFLAESRNAKLGPRDWHEELPHHDLTGSDKAGEEDTPSIFIPGPGEAGLAQPSASRWVDVRSAFTQRLLIYRGGARSNGKGMDATLLTGTGGSLPQPGVPGRNNWIPLGPSAIRKGQATGNPPVSGRALRLAIAPGGNRVYVATADGGVWRSDNAGTTWKSTMDAFDLDPTEFASTSNACGAIAIDLADPDRVYVGTGEGDTFLLFDSRTISALPSYHGVGPVVSNDGGQSWIREQADSTSPTLAGSAFFSLTVDPADRENVVGATNVGLYRREPNGAGGHHWVQKRGGIHTSVLSCGDGTTTTFYAAQDGGGVFSSTDGGNTWSSIGPVPSGAVRRITLAARPTDPSILYAFAASGSSFLLFRRDGSAVWLEISGLPNLGSQANYNLSIAVDPNDANTVYLAGSSFASDGSIFRCPVTVSGAGGSVTSTFIGTGVHADVHELIHAPGDSSTLWAACDGGVFRTVTATSTGTFTHRNTGLATLCGNFFSQHPTQTAVIVLGLQDNGTARYTGEECWTHIFDGDGGYPIINWADPNRVLVYANGVVRRATDGGQSTASFSTVLALLWVVMTELLVGSPYNPSSPGDAETVAFGAGTLLFISSDFGATWGAAVATLLQNIFALTFATPQRLYLGTTLGQIFRFDSSGGVWNQTRIDNAAGGPLPLSGVITDIEVDPVDATGVSLYITFGGSGDRRHVWHFDGTQWQDRSGTAAAGLLDVEHNAIVADPLSPSTLSVGCDVGVWRSIDSGSSRAPLQDGLPDAAVFDLQIHQTARWLRASTGGRGMFELKLDPPSQPDVHLLVRDTALDLGQGSTVDGLPDPEDWPAQPVLHYLSRNIKLDVPTPSGYQTATSDIGFVDFNDIITDGSEHTATLDPALGTVVNRVYVEVHNRGIVNAANVSVMLLVGNASAGLPPLPSGYETNVRNGTPISAALWQTVGIQTLSNLSAALPQVASFRLPSTMLPPPSSLPGQAHYCVLALLHSTQDAFTSVETNTDVLTIADRKVALHNLHVVQFVDTPPPGGNSVWERLDLWGYWGDQRLMELVIDARFFNGRLMVILPPDLKVDQLTGLRDDKKRRPQVKAWAERHTAILRQFIEQGRFNGPATKQMIFDIRNATQGRLLASAGEGEKSYMLSGLPLQPRKRYTLFLYFEPTSLETGNAQTVQVVVRDMKTKEIQGGSTYRIALTQGEIPTWYVLILSRLLVRALLTPQIFENELIGRSQAKDKGTRISKIGTLLGGRRCTCIKGARSGFF